MKIIVIFYVASLFRVYGDRTKFSCEATFVLLQELVDQSENQMRVALENDYEFFTDGSTKLSYFCAILIKKDRHVNVLNDSFEVNLFFW